MQRYAVGLCLLLSAASAEAYVGPGMGLGVIGALLGLLTAVFLAVVGVVWYPLKRMLRGKSNGAAPATRPLPNGQSSPPGSQSPLRR